MVLLKLVRPSQQNTAWLKVSSNLGVEPSFIEPHFDCVDYRILIRFLAISNPNKIQVSSRALAIVLP